MKKIAWGVVFAIAVFAFVVYGCKRQGAVDKSDPNYPIEISIYIESGSNTQPSKNNPIYNWIKEKLER